MAQHRDLTTELQRPMGPEGYLVIATRTPSYGDNADQWTREHLVMYHDWGPEVVAEAFEHEGDLCSRHHDEHDAYEEGRGELYIRHTHFHGLQYAIAQSELPRGIKNGWLEILRRLGDEAYAPPEDR